MAWEAAQLFSEQMDTVGEMEFEEWWQNQWEKHYDRCEGIAKHVYIMEKSIKTATTQQQLRELMSAKCLEVGMAPEPFMTMAWPRALKKFNGGE